MYLKGTAGKLKDELDMKHDGKRPIREFLDF